MISARDTDDLARFYTVTDPTTHKKGYTVYKVTARIISRKNPDDVQEITVWKRYSDFKKLHRDLWQIHKNHFGQAELFPPFAKAKVFGRFDDSVIEERRQCSEDLLQFSANIPALYGSQYIQDFFKGGEVQDCSELIGPAEPFSGFLADSLSVGSAEGVSSSSLLSSHALDSDSVDAAVDADSAVNDGMPSGSISPNHAATRSGSFPVSQPVTSTGRAVVESSRSGGVLTFAPSLRNCTGRTDYLEKASEQIALAVQKEVEQEFAAAFSYYQKGVDLLLQGVQGELSPRRREAVKKKTAEYLMRAELISTHLDSMGQSSTQSRALGPQCCGVSWTEQTHSDELKHYRVLGVIDKVLLVMDKRTQETFILKGLRKSNECGHVKKTVIPRSVPHMVGLEKFIISEDSIFLLLQYAEGGKLWSHICKYLHSNSPDKSFDIPFIQKPYTTVVCSAPSPMPTGSSDAGSQQGEDAETHLPHMSDLSLRECPSVTPLQDSDGTSEEECTNSYLTLCNEYEQEKVEPGTLAAHDDAGETEEEVAAVTPELNRTCSMMSTGSLCSPISEQELRFFTEEEQTAQPDCLNPSASMDLFCIDNKDSTSDICKLTLSDPDVEVSEEPTEENVPDFWRSADDQGPSEMVPVISFKEAILEDTADNCTDEAQPPDLLVNLPEVGGGAADTSEEKIFTGSGAYAVGSKTSPTFGRPDVLQRGEETELDLSVDVAIFDSSEKPFTDVFDKHNLSSFKPSDGLDTAVFKPPTNSVKGEDVESGSEEISGETEGRNVHRLFRELDELAEVALQTRIPEALVRSWAADMIVALDALHQEGIICRDLNPSNILLNNTGHVELTYFCSWNDVEESCDPDALSKLYCAPEVGGIGEETAACDWWSFGALLFELLVGKSLYHCHPAGISRHTSLNIPEFVSDEARSLLEQLLQYNPLERLGSGVAGVEDIKSHPFFAHVNWTN